MLLSACLLPPPSRSSLTMPPSSTSTSSTPTVTAANARSGADPSFAHQPPPPPSSPSSRIPVTPAVLRSIFASSRTILEERSLSRVAFFRYGELCHTCTLAHSGRIRFTGFLLSCIAISLAAARGRGIKGGAALLGVGLKAT